MMCGRRLKLRAASLTLELLNFGCKLVAGERKIPFPLILVGACYPHGEAPGGYTRHVSSSAWSWLSLLGVG